MRAGLPMVVVAVEAVTAAKVAELLADLLGAHWHAICRSL
jgi:hypothetical protein